MDTKTVLINYLKKSLTIKERASRAEFWFFYCILLLVDNFLSIPLNIKSIEFDSLTATTLFVGLWGIITLLVLLCVTIRRFHDVNISGKWILYYSLLIIVFFILLIIAAPVYEAGASKDLDLWVVIIGFIGIIILAIIGIIIIVISLIAAFFVLFKKGTVGDNRFGADPLEKPLAE